MALQRQDPLRVGLIGFGLAGRVFHGPLLAANPRFVVTCIATRDPGRQADAAARHPEAVVVASPESVLARAADLDLIVLASPPATHVPLAMAALDAGLAVVSDKPLCASVEDGQRLIEHAARTGQPLTVFQNRRWDGDFLTVRRLVESGALGEVRRFESRFERWKPEEVKAWRRADPAEAGGVVHDLGSHLVDQAIQLFGPVVDLHAEVTSYSGSGAPDDGFLAMRHEGGTRSHLWMSSVAGQLGPRFRVLGSAGAFTSWGLDVQEAQLAAGLDPRDPGYGVTPADHWPVVGLDGTTERVRPERGNYPAFYDGVAGALLNGSPLPVDARDSVDSVRVIESAHRVFG